METTTKLAIGISALCSLASAAFAGGPEMPAIDMNGINFGLGFGYKTYTFDYRATREDGTTFFNDNYSHSLNQFGPLGELGYTWAGYHWAFGILGQFEYDNVRVTDQTVHQSTRVRLGSHVNAMLMAGFKVTECDLLYLEGGYSAIWGKTTLFPHADGAVAAPSVHKSYTLSGGIMGIGWRHYFMSDVFLDVSYDYALYASKSDKPGNLLTSTFTSATNTVTSTVYSPKRVAVNGITATANYLFNL